MFRFPVHVGVRPWFRGRRLGASARTSSQLENAKCEQRDGLQLVPVHGSEPELTMHCAIARVKIACIYAMQLALLSNHPHNHGLEGSSHHERKGGGGKDYGKKSSVKRMSSQNPAFFLSALPKGCRL